MDSWNDRPVFPYSELLRELARFTTPDGAHHVVESPRGQLLCGKPRPLESAADTAWRGEDAYAMATCPTCKLAAERIVAGAGVEVLAAEAQAGPMARMVRAHADGDHAKLKTEALRLEQRNYFWFWVALVMGVLCIALGAPDLGYFVAILGSAMRLVWLLLRRPLLGPS